MTNIYTSIDIGSDTIRILISEYYKKKFYTLAVSSVKSKGVKNGVIVDEGLLSERIKLSLNDIYERIDIEINKALLVIPAIGVEFNLVHGNIPIINMEKMVTKKDIIRVESSVINDIAPNMELVNVTPIDYTIYDNGSEIETTKDPVNKICDRLGIRAMITTVPKVNIISYVKLLENLGIEVVDISLSPICDYEEVRNEEMDNGVTCLINVGKNMTNISIFNKGIITNSTNINIGSKVIDDDISYVYNLSYKNARKIKENFAYAHINYANKTETYEIKDKNDKYVSINQYEVSKIVNKRLFEILNIAKNELKVLTNKQISYIMVLGGIIDIPTINYLIEDVFGSNAGIYSNNTLGIRKSRFITASGSIKFFVKKLEKRGKEYTMLSKDEIDNMIHSKTKIGKNDSIFGRFFNYFFDN